MPFLEALQPVRIHTAFGKIIDDTLIRKIGSDGGRLEAKLSPNFFYAHPLIL